MSIVIDVMKLALFLSGGFLYLFGNGWGIIFLLIKKAKVEQQGNLPKIIPLAWMSGLIINLGLALIIQSLPIALLVGVLNALFGLGHFFLYLRRGVRDNKIVYGSMNGWIGILFVMLIFLSRVMISPISGWDARTIWFYHAKLIYFSQSIGLDAGWLSASVMPSHFDYPKLISLLAAQVAFVAGFWNEYLPKLALFFIFSPGLMLLLGQAKWRLSSVLLFLLVPLSFERVLWNGYMDGYLALYAALAAFFLGKYSISTSFWDLISGLLSTTLLLYVKNEGMLAVLAILSLTILFFYWQNRRSLAKFGEILQPQYLLPFLLLWLPMLLWQWYKAQWGLSNDLKLGSNDSLAMLQSRMTDGSYHFIFESLHTHLNTALSLTGLLLLALIIWKVKFPKSAYLPISIAISYSLGMALVYFVTPHDLYWHIQTSVGRTMLVANAFFFVAAYFMFDEIESKHFQPN